ncbi:MAG TPA: hypothetical protein VFC82_01905 [Actinomycetaceae bacterium]|nr:hypothetical protein [Actinomycetaceae bacterium]
MTTLQWSREDQEIRDAIIEELGEAQSSVGDLVDAMERRKIPSEACKYVLYDMLRRNEVALDSHYRLKSCGRRPA